MQLQKKLFTAAIIFVMISAKAQTETQFSGWLTSFNSFTIKKRLRIDADAQIRSEDKLQNIKTFLFTTDIGYHLHKNITLATGITFSDGLKNVDNISGYFIEYQYWERFVLSLHLRAMSITQMLRIEQRFIPNVIDQNNNLKRDGNFFAERLRYLIRSMLPLKKQNSFEKGLYAAIQNELLVNVGDKSAVNGNFFDQNRFYIGIGYRFSASFDAEFGYINQYIGEGNHMFTNNNILQWATYVHL